MSILSVINQKGGVAKTTTSINIAACWAKQGQRVLLVDLDPQSSATRSIFAEREFDHTIYDVMMNDLEPRQAIVHSDTFGVDLIPSEIMLSGLDLQLAAHFGRERVLKKKLQAVESDYDVVIIDCPPSLGLLTVNALLASQEIIIPICPEYFSAKGISLILDTIQNIKSGLGHRIGVKGLVITRYRDRRITRQIIEEIGPELGLKVFSDYIPDNVAVEEAHYQHRPLVDYKPQSKAAMAYQKLSEELWRELI